MEGTSSPTVAGIYWCERRNRPTVLTAIKPAVTQHDKVKYGHNTLLAYLLKIEGENEGFPPAELDAYWYGPLTPPPRRTNDGDEHDGRSTAGL